MIDYTFADRPLSEWLESPSWTWILQELWGLSASQIETERFKYDHYLRRYNSCFHYQSTILATCTHRQTVSVARAILTQTRADCEAKIISMLGLTGEKQSFRVDDCVRSIGRTLLCLDLSRWSKSEDLPTYLRNCIGGLPSQGATFRLPRSFNARNIKKIGCINIQWGDTLNRHLEVRGNDTDVIFFHCYSVLDLYEKSGHAKRVFPPGFVDETKRTFSLFLPVAEQTATLWYRKEATKYDLDPAAASASHLNAIDRNIQSFGYWRDRIIIVKEVYDEHEPKGLLQFWRDDRKSMQWWTFWAAFAAYIISLIACIEGAMQVYKAYHPTMPAP